MTEAITIHDFWTGCRQSTQGCANCYVKGLADPVKITRATDAIFKKPLKWKKPRTILVCDNSDFFLKEADEFRADAWNIIKQAKQHRFIIITRWSERIKACLPEDWDRGYPNVAIGISVQTNKNAHYRIMNFFETPAQYRLLVVEPILEPMDLRPYLRVRGKDDPNIFTPFDQVIIGGETGTNARPSQITWYQEIMQQCKFAKTPAYIRQLGAFLAKEHELADGKGADFNDLKFPLHLKVRQPMKEPK